MRTSPAASGSAGTAAAGADGPAQAPDVGGDPTGEGLDGLTPAPGVGTVPEGGEAGEPTQAPAAGTASDAAAGPDQETADQEAADQGAPLDPHVAPTRGRLTSWRPASWRFVVLLGVLALAALLVCGGLGYRAHTARAVEAAGAQALRAATDAAEVVLSYDHRRLDRDVARARGLITGRFEREYMKFVRTAVRPTAERTGAVVVADVRAASVVSASPHRVVLVLFVNQTTTLKQRPEPRVDLTRVRMTMERVGERWLVSQVEAL